MGENFSKYVDRRLSELEITRAEAARRAATQDSRAASTFDGIFSGEIVCPTPGRLPDLARALDVSVSTIRNELSADGCEYATEEDSMTTIAERVKTVGDRFVSLVQMNPRGAVDIINNINDFSQLADHLGLESKEADPPSGISGLKAEIAQLRQELEQAVQVPSAESKELQELKAVVKDLAEGVRETVSTLKAQLSESEKAFNDYRAEAEKQAAEKDNQIKELQAAVNGNMPAGVKQFFGIRATEDNGNAVTRTPQDEQKQKGMQQLQSVVSMLEGK